MLSIILKLFLLELYTLFTIDTKYGAIQLNLGVEKS